MGKNVIVISLLTQHLGVLTNSHLNVCAFQIELEFGNDALGARERTDNNLNPHGWLARGVGEGSGTPIPYLYGYVPPKGVVILKLLI